MTFDDSGPNRTAAEEIALRAADARIRLAAIVENSDDAIISRALDGTILTWNRAAERLFGFSEAEAVGRQAADLMPLPGHAEIKKHTAMLLAGERIPPVEVVRADRDGRLIDVLLTISPIRNDAGEVTGASIILRDISALKQAQHELQHKAGLAQLLEALARDVNEASTPQAAMQSCVARICNYGGWALGHVGIFRPGQALGIPVSSVWHCPDPERFEAFMRLSDRFDYSAATGKFISIVLREKQPMWIADIAASRGSSGRLAEAMRYGLYSAFAFPVVVGGEVTAFLEFLSAAPRAPDTAFLAAVSSIAGNLARAIERQRANESHAQLAAIVENSRDAIISRSLDGTILSWNTAAEQLLGYSADEALGQPIGIIVPPDCRHEIKENSELLLAGGRVPPTETTLTTKDGRRIDVMLSVSPIKNEDGILTGAAVILRDISELKRAGEMRVQLAAIVESSSDAILSRTLDGTILTWNKSAERLFGYSAAEALGSNVSMLIPADRAAEAQNNLMLLHQGSTLPPYETVRLAKDGRRVDVSISAAPIMDDAGNVMRVAIIFHDVTERKHAETMLRLAASVFDSAAEGIMITNENNNIISVNHAFTKITGYPAQEAIGKNPRLLSSGLQPQAFYDAMWAAIRETGQWQGEIWDQRKSGEPYCELLSITTIRNESGKVAYHCAIFMDITQRKMDEAELMRLNADLENRVAQRTAELERVNKELEAFSYSISHDLRAPLRAVTGFSRIVLDANQDKLDEGSVSHLQKIQSGAARMARLIDDLLALSRVSRQEMRKRNVDLTALARQVADALAQAHPEQNVRVTIKPDTRADCDPGLIGIALENLIGNAWKFTSRTNAARIEIGSDQRRGETVYFVRDNGAGFDMKYADKLFAPFQRLHGSKEFEGTGIGLSIVARIVAKHGGRVWAEARPGKGATFYFTLG